ncbi:hypothetical protein FEM48_Zijuj07G0039200 [Ziziphus jujuba var. spinosa]|uniref:Uncharacterized protein n=1 Tax=Ziziphus jujuba var. spinosa TaxID=714518 RepID=A0A978V2A8_ZIZJJ|nr:hypothetical protein FEM48_Zijuj07G0039200 [Ziziphus jujuba var. spinosa]
MLAQSFSVEAPNLLKASLKLLDKSMDEPSYIALVHLSSNLNSVKKMVVEIGSYLSRNNKKEMHLALSQCEASECEVIW